LTAYASGTNGGSGYFDGTGDYLDIGSNAAFGYGTGDFTIEFWVYPTVISGSTPNLIDQRNGTASSQVVPTIYLNNGVLTYYTTGANQITGSSVPANSWNHVALCRSGTSTKLFLNGAQVGSTLSDSNNYVTSAVRVFSSNDGTPVAQAGFCSGLRIVKGTAVYTAAFTPPTAPLTAITNTSLLCNFTNGGIIDNAMSNVLETVGGAAISTTQSKFGGASMYFDGTGDYLYKPSDINLTFGSGDFTLEMWIYPTSLSGTISFLYATRPASTNGVYPVLYATSSGTYWFVSSADRISGSALSTNTWSHVVVCRSGTSTKMFINGTQSGSTYTDSNNYLMGRLYLGASDFNSGGSEYLNGYIDDLRITKGYARYTANFTAPVVPFPLFGD